MRFARLKVILVATVVTLAALSQAPAALAACSANTANLGQVTGSFTIGKTGSYRVWTRMSVPDSSNNSYTLEIDGTTCNITVGDAVASVNTWTWVDYKDGNTGSKIDLTLAAGTHTYTMYGRESNVKVDRVVFSPTTSCVPSSFGDNCLVAPDTTPPSTPTNLASPSKTTTSITLTWAASTDDSGTIASYELYRGGTLVKTIASPTLTATDTGLTAATNYSYQVAAVDGAGLKSTKSTALSVNTNVAPPAPDTQAPTVPTGLTSTGKSATNIVMSWKASTDNTAVAGYKLFRDGTEIMDISAATLSYDDRSVVGSTTYKYQVSAYDAANNKSARSAEVSVTTSAPATPKPGDFTSDNKVDFHDLLSLLSQYGKNNPTYDLSGDGKVDFHDLLNLLSKYGK